MLPGLAGPRLNALAVLLLSFAASSCGLQPRTQFLPNQPPQIALDRAAFVSAGELAVTWKARDPDGRVDHYVYRVDPPSVDRVDGSWVHTSQTSTVARFSRSAALGRAFVRETMSEPRIFAVRAVDDGGAMSLPMSVAVFDSNELAPMVVIDHPPPNGVFTTIVSPTVEIRWHGDDPDGRVVKYKFRLFGAANPDHPEISDFISLVTSNPDTLRGLYAPHFAEWDSLPANKTSIVYSNLIPNQLYLFAITAIDEDGNYDPVFSLSTNVLRLAVTDADIGSPFLCVSSPFFNYCSPIPGDFDLRYEIPTGVLPVSWSAAPQPGMEITGYRWVLDPPDTKDIKHWTAWKLTNTSTTIGPFSAGSQHTLYVQAKDNLEHVSTLRLRLGIFDSTPTRELLVVDDTRLTPDQRNSTGALDPPRGTWPSAAELDTFLYARGGNPWQGYPSGTLSSPGILNGYDFDTLGTRGILTGIVPLPVLDRYRQVIWLTDDVGATYTGSPMEQLAPTTSLRLMSSPGQQNTLSAYVAQGGKLWLMGGGAAYATLISWGRPNTPPDDWTKIDQELIPGRFMYDFPHWQSAIAIAPARHGLINTPDWSPWPNAQMGRGWSGQGIHHDLSQPDYTKLASIQVLSGRTCASDPPSPLRFCNSFYLVTSFPAEFVGRVPPNSSTPNFVREDLDPRSNHEQLVSTLDTLYTATGGAMPGPLPVMTYYHGFESGPVVFSGFPVWYFQRAQGQTLVDFVLQDIWGLTKKPGTTPVALSSRRR